MYTDKISGKSKSVAFKFGVTMLALMFIVVLGPGLLSIDVSQATGGHWHKPYRTPTYCSDSAEKLLIACHSEVSDDYLTATANCINVSDPAERKECEADAWDEKIEGRELCKEQFDARLEVCDLVGEERYDPDFDPENFLRRPVGNDYFPLGVGNKWVYEGEGEVDTVEVLRATKLIEGVTCIVVSDVVEEDGEVIEDTDDWYAQHIDTEDVWYCGEIAKNYETFEGDAPEVPELVDIEGSWKAGRDGAKPGILIEANPQPGNAYRQELLFGDAEDVAQVLSNTYVFGGDTGNPESLDYMVPEGLANQFCSVAEPCVVTRDFTALEPGILERKYYAKGIGVFLEVNLNTGDIVQLVGCNFGGKCTPISD